MPVSSLVASACAFGWNGDQSQGPPGEGGGISRAYEIQTASYHRYPASTTDTFEVDRREKTQFRGREMALSGVEEVCHFFLLSALRERSVGFLPEDLRCVERIAIMSCENRETKYSAFLHRLNNRKE